MTSREQILSLFRRRHGEFVSGQEISQELNISRAAVWKQVELLREQGFEIHAQRSRGYCLVQGPDMLLAQDVGADLGGQWLDWTVRCLEDTDSTNVQARKLADEGAPDGTVIIADRQSAGRGRMGRRWESPAGVNLYCSILLRPKFPLQQVPQLTFLSAVAAAQTLNNLGGLSARVKWPNDLLVKGRKIAGLLNEMSAEGDQINFVILGLGINLNMKPEQLPDDLRYPATSVLMETGRAVVRLEFMRDLLRNFEQWYGRYLQEGFGVVREHWEELSDLLGQKVRVDLNPGEKQGQVTGLDQDGALLIRLSDGSVERILAGDVYPL